MEFFFELIFVLTTFNVRFSLSLFHIFSLKRIIVYLNNCCPRLFVILKVASKVKLQVFHLCSYFFDTQNLGYYRVALTINNFLKFNNNFIIFKMSENLIICSKKYFELFIKVKILGIWNNCVLYLGPIGFFVLVIQ